MVSDTAVDDMVSGTAADLRSTMRPAQAMYQTFCFDPDCGPLSELHTAAMLGSHDDVERLIARHSHELDRADLHGYTALHHAALSSSVECVLLLIERGACLDAKTKTNATALHVAAHNGRLSTCKLLVTKGADVHAVDDFGCMALYDATYDSGRSCPCGEQSDVQRGRTAAFLRSVMAMPRAKAADVVARSWALYVSERLHEAVCEPAPSARLSKLLRHFRTYVDARDYDGATALHEAARSGRMEAARALLDARADVTLTTNLGETPLHLAAREARAMLVRLLVEHGADVRARSRAGLTPLEEARRAATMQEWDPASTAGAHTEAEAEAGVASSEEIIRFLGVL